MNCMMKALSWRFRFQRPFAHQISVQSLQPPDFRFQRLFTHQISVQPLQLSDFRFQRPFAHQISVQSIQRSDFRFQRPFADQISVQSLRFQISDFRGPSLTRFQESQKRMQRRWKKMKCPRFRFQYGRCVSQLPTYVVGINLIIFGTESGRTIGPCSSREKP